MIAVVITALMASLSYAGAVRLQALGLFILPTVVTTALLCVRMSRRRHPAAVAAVGAFVALGGAEIVNVVSGLSYGPAARSSFAAAGGTALAVAAARSRYAALFLLAVLEIVGGAFALGAGGEVEYVAVATGACALVALVRLDAGRARWSGPSRMAGSVIAGLLVVIGVGVVAVTLQDEHVTRRPAVLFPAVTDQAVHPFWHEHAVSPPPKQRSKAAAPAGPTAAPRALSHRPEWLSPLLVAVGALLCVLALLVVVRLLIVRRAWQRLRVRLSSGDPNAAAVGAWTWLRTSLTAARRQLPMDLPPERATEGAAAVPAAFVEQLASLGAVAALGAFAVSQSVTASDAAASWEAADAVVAAVVAELSRLERLSRRWRKPLLPGARVARASTASSVVSSV